MNIDRLILWGVGLLTLCRYALAMSLELTEEEALMWMESKHLTTFFFDNGPLAPLLIRLGTLSFGETLLGIRCWNPLLMLLASWLVYLLARSVYRKEIARWCVVVFQIVPLANIAAIHMLDVGLALCLALTGYWCLWRALHRVHRWHGAWWGGGIAFGSAITISLPLVSLLLGIALALSLTRRWRDPWSRPGVWVLLGMAMIVPVVLCLASGHGGLALRQTMLGVGFHPGQMMEGVWRGFLWTGPMLLLGMGWMCNRWRRVAPAQGPWFLGILGFVPLIVVFIWSGTFESWSYVWWVGMVPCLIVLVGHWVKADIDLEWKSGWQRLALIFTGGLTAIGVNTPNLQMLGIPWPDFAATPRLSQGWEETAEAVEAVLRSGSSEAPEGLFVIAETPEMAALLDFYLAENALVYRPEGEWYPRIHVVESAGWDSSYDLWPNYSHEAPNKAQRGSPYLRRTALYLTGREEDYMPANLSNAFKSTVIAAVLDIKRRHLFLHHWRLYHAYQYGGLPL